MSDKELINSIKEYVDWAYDTNIAKLTYDEINDFYDLVMRQQKQLDNYSHNVRNMSKDFIAQQKIIQEQQAEIEKLTINMNAFGLGMKREKERADNIRVEAIKEFAKKLKECEYKEEYEDHLCYMVDNLVEEMVGEQQ